MSQLPPRMHRYRRELEAAIAADRRRTRRRRLGGVAAAVVAVLVAVNLLPSGGERPGVAPASAVERAAQALQPRDGTILHVRMEGRQFDDERPDIHWSHESWTRVGEGAMRSIETQPDGTVAETAQTATTSSLWDADGKRVLEMPIPEAEQAGGDTEDPFRAEALQLLRSGQARVAGRRRVDGREALRIAGNDGSRTFLVDARTYAPIELRTRGTGGGTVLRFAVYETVPAGEELLSISAQHGDAPVVRDAAAFEALQAELFANG